MHPTYNFFKQCKYKKTEMSTINLCDATKVELELKNSYIQLTNIHDGLTAIQIG